MESEAWSPEGTIGFAPSGTGTQPQVPLPAASMKNVLGGRGNGVVSWSVCAPTASTPGAISAPSWTEKPNQPGPNVSSADVGSIALTAVESRASGVPSTSSVVTIVENSATAWAWA